jgi:hypothetical protein
MKSLNVKVGDKGKYRDYGACEVVFVKPNDAYFVTSSDTFIPQVHEASGGNVRPRDHTSFDFVPEPKTVRVAVWADENGCVYASAASPPTGRKPVYVNLEMPQ